MSRRYASRRYAGGLGPSRIRTRIPTNRQLGQWVSLRKTLRFRVRLQLSQSRCLSLLLAMSGRVFLFLPPRGHEAPPTLRDRLNPNLSLYRHRFPIPRYAKRPDVALYTTVGPFFLLPTPSYEGVKLQTLFLYLFGVYCMFHQYSNHIQSENRKTENRKIKGIQGLINVLTFFPPVLGMLSRRFRYRAMRLDSLIQVFSLYYR